MHELNYNFTPKENEVVSAVHKLQDKYRVVILLYYFEGYSISEIASILGQGESTIGSKLYRARKLLKVSLKEDFDNE